MGTSDDEVKHENDQPDPVSTTTCWVSLVILTVDIGYNCGQGAIQRHGVRTLLIGCMGVLGLFCIEFTFFLAMNCPRLMSWTPKVSIVIDFLGVSFSIFWLLLLPLFFPLAVLRMFSSLFLNLALSFSFAFIRGRGLKSLGWLEIFVLEFLDDRGKCDNMLLFR